MHIFLEFQKHKGGVGWGGGDVQAFNGKRAFI